MSIKEGKTDKVRLRHEALQELIKTYPVENQAMLVTLLKEKYGIDTNQSIVSRDLHDLEVSKQKYKDTTIYELKSIDASKEILRLGVKDVVHNESLIVIKTLAGLADFVGDYLDAQKEASILATLAGENVVFVTPSSVHKTETVFKMVCKLVHFKQKENAL